MSAPEPTPADLQHALGRTADLYDALHDVLGDTREIGSRRELLVHGTCSTALEHGLSIGALLPHGQLASAIVLLRAQFEAVTRALWLLEVAEDAWIDRYFESLKTRPDRDPDPNLKLNGMLEALAATRHAAAARMLRQLKDAAWDPLNSYVHTGIHAIVQQHVDVSAGYALQTLVTANGLTCMAAMIMAILSADEAVAGAVRQVQLEHLDCLPPIAPMPDGPDTDTNIP